MKQILFLALTILALGHCFYKKPVEGKPEDYNETVARINAAVKDQKGDLYHASWERLAYFVDSIGPRLWGSDQLEMAIDELIANAEDIGFDAVYRDPVVDFTKWVRKDESLTLYDPRPFPQDLKLIGLGKTVAGDVKAEVVVVTDWDDLESKKNMLKGKIVCYSVDWVDYDTTVAYRSAGPSRAAKYGAVASLVRSITPFSIESPHTGGVSYSKDLEIPAAAISVEDAKMFLRMWERGQKIVVHLKLDSEFVPGQNSSNVIAEIHGTEYPDEIILFGGHFDSWDTGSQTGANDDGGGVMTCFEALRAIHSLGLKPKRTLRFIAWSGEEYGGTKGGDWQYARGHADEMANHVLAFESDLGSTLPFGMGFTGNDNNIPIIKSILDANFGQINATTLGPEGTMVDTGPLDLEGVPTMKNLIQDLPNEAYYFTFHHSAGDSMDIMNPDWMDDNVVMIASMMYIVADLDERLPPNEKKADSPFVRKDVC